MFETLKAYIPNRVKVLQFYWFLSTFCVLSVYFLCIITRKILE